MDIEFLDSKQLEMLTGTRASAWRYWASIGEGPASFKLGRRRVWKRSTVHEWLAEQAVFRQQRPPTGGSYRNSVLSRVPFSHPRQKALQMIRPQSHRPNCGLLATSKGVDMQWRT